MLLLALFSRLRSDALFLPEPVFERIKIMALFTKLFTRDVEPYSTKTRWYQVVIKNNAIISHDFKQNISLVVGSTGLFISFPDLKKISILTYYPDAYMTAPDSSNRSYTKQVLITANGECRIPINPPGVSYDKLIVYILARES